MVKVALVQVASPDGEPFGARVERVADAVAGLRGVDLVVLPELWGVGYNNFASYGAAAEEWEGGDLAGGDLAGGASPTLAAFAPLARGLGCHLHVGSVVERRPSGALRNTAVLLGPDGQVAHTYSKVHVFGYASQEKDLLEPGSSVGAATTPFGVLAATTCYDLRFPGLWSELVAAGAELVVVPAAWPARRRGHWRLLTAARAVDNQVYVLACNAAGGHAGVRLGGASRVVDPWGVVLGEAGEDGEEVLVVDLDPGAVGRTRAEFPALRDRLPDYRVLRP